ncbi:MAG: ankyrin repeat domain-containing protein [Candidatus Lernaella stagnicola]|nr:ankyrin repeat domain-containing protein [Candidatus Lernaella stagnicola]
MRTRWIIALPLLVLLMLLPACKKEAPPSPTGSMPELHRAVRAGDLAEVKRLLAAGSDPDVVAELNETPLIYAIKGRHAEIARALVAGGADVNHASTFGRTPLFYVPHFQKEMAVWLLEAGAKVDVRTSNGSGILHELARETGDADLMRLMIRHGADPNLTTPNGWTPLHTAVNHAVSRVPTAIFTNEGMRIGSVPDDAVGLNLTRITDEKVRVLLEAGARVNAANDAGDTPLHLAAKKDLANTARILIEAGADKNAKNKKGLTPADVAAKFDHRDTLNVLREKSGGD